MRIMLVNNVEAELLEWQNTAKSVFDDAEVSTFADPMLAIKDSIRESPDGVIASCSMRPIDYLDYYNNRRSKTKLYVVIFFLSGILAAMAGLMLCARTTSGDPTIANDMTINAVTAAVLGGVTFSGGEGKMAGTIAGAIVVGILINVLFYLNITGFYTYFVQGIILIVSVVVNNWRKGGAANA